MGGSTTQVGKRKIQTPKARHAMSTPQQQTAGVASATPVTVLGQNIVGTQNTVASGVMSYQGSGVDTPDAGEPAPQLSEQKHKSLFRRKKEKREKKKQEKLKKKKLEQEEFEQEEFEQEEFGHERFVKEDSIFVEEEQEEENQEEENQDTYLLKIEDTIEKMDREFEAELKNPQAKRAVLAKHHNEVWNSLTAEERTSLKNYTFDYKTSDGHPYFTTMNAILRKGLYEKGKGGDTPFQRGAADDVVEKSKLNYDAVTNCINALKKSKLPQDMIFRRGTSMITLLYMLRLNRSDDPKEWMKQLRKDLDLYNEGTNVILDRGFLSTASFPNTGLDGEVEWIIQGHAGDEAFFIGEESIFWEEGETLFQAGTKFRLLKICPPGTGSKIYMGDQKTTWKVYLETITDFAPLRGSKKYLE